MRSRVRVALAASLLLVPIGAGGVRAQSPAFTMTTLAYGPDPAQVLDLYVPNGAPDPLPAVVLAHGGLWAGGDRSHLATMCVQIMIEAAAGMACATIDYRLSGSLGGVCTAPGIDTYSDQSSDMAAAFALVQSEAAAFGLDPGRIFLGGHSAGGHLAHVLNLRWDDFAPTCTAPSGCPAPAGAIGLEGIYDITAWDAYDVSFWGGQYACSTRQAFGAPATESPSCVDAGYGLACWDVGSPTYLALNDGPLGIAPAGDALLMHSPGDDWVDIEEAIAFGAAMRGAFPETRVVTSVDGSCATGSHFTVTTQESVARCIVDFMATTGADPAPTPSLPPGAVAALVISLTAAGAMSLSVSRVGG